MAKSPTFRLTTIISEYAKSILADWLSRIASSPDDRLPAEELEAQCETIVSNLAMACRDGHLTDIDAPSFAPLRDAVVDMSLTRALQGISAKETATFILSLKAPLFARVRAVLTFEPERLAAEILSISELIDALALFMMEALQHTREELIHRQQTDITELSTPVVKLWQGIVAVPLVGTLDTVRTQLVMENLLESIVRHEAVVAIIDITDVPAIDDLVAQHVLNTIAAARLMGTDCIISGIRPHIAQTMVHLGVELNVVTKANLSDAFALALRRVGKVVVNQPCTEHAAPLQCPEPEVRRTMRRM
jgi:rsbT co-antagonist protein RsbR